jgi:hypothetical protein
MVGIALSLGLIAGAMALMSGALPGAAALYVVAAALTILGPAIAVFGQMDTGTIIKGLVVIAGALLVLAGVSALIAPVVPVLVALAAAVALIGAAVFLTGAGVALFAAGLAALAINGAAGFEALKNIIMDFMNFLPEVVLAFGDTISAIAEVIGTHVPELQAAFTALLLAMINAAIKLIPKFGQLISKLIETGLKVIVNYYDDLVRSGLELIERILDGVGDAIPDIADEAGDLIENFINALATQGVRLANAGLDALIRFLNGLAFAIRSHQADLNEAGRNLADAVIDGVISFIGSIGGEVWSAFQNMINNAVGRLHIPDIPGVPGIRAANGIDPQLQNMAERLGLISGVDDVKAAFDTMGRAIDQGLDDARNKMAKAKERLDKLKKEGKGQSKEADKQRKIIKDQEQAIKELRNEEDKWRKGQKQHRKDLLDMAHTWDFNAQKIKEAEDALKAAKDARDSFQAGVTSQFGAKPDISKGMSLQSYMRQIVKKTQETQKFMETLQKLRAENLSDASYRQLLAEGTDAQKLMEQLLAGGSDAIKKYNEANAALEGAAGTLASAASVSLFYDAGVAQAESTLQGWKDTQGALEEQMGVIARAMVKAIKKALKMKSPSKLFRDVGRFSSEGVSLGLKDGMSGVKAASEEVGLTALDTLKATMNKGVDAGVLDMNPTIVPVLDLTQLQKDATEIGSMLATEPIVASVSYERAASISSDQQAALEAALAQINAQGTGDTTVEYTQILQSPKAISPNDTYRATKSAIPLMKEALNI